MIKIRVNGTWLDVPQQDISFHFATMRFFDAFSDTFSTDIELPLTTRNMQALGVWGLTDRSGQLFGTGIACYVVTGVIYGDARLQVNAVSDGEGTISATLYMLSLPSTLADNFNSIAVDSSDTIIDLHEQTLEPFVRTSDINITQYDYGVDLGSAGAYYLPNITLDGLLSRISTAAGVTITPTGVDYRILAARHKVCPQNTRMNLLYVSQTPSTAYNSTFLYGGQHVAAEVDSDGYIGFNRGCTAYADITVQAGTIASGSQRVRIQRSSNGGDSWATVMTINLSTSGQVTTQSTPSMSMGSNTMLRIQGFSDGVATSAQTFVALTITGYDITEDDYDTDFVFVDHAVPTWAPVQTLSYNYYGVICNLPSYTVRELLSSLAWKMGAKIQVSGTTITFVSPDVSKNIDAVIDSTHFATDLLGRKNTFMSADGVQQLAFYIANSALEEEKVIHQSAFAYINDTTNSTGTMARIPHWAWELKDDGTATLTFVELDGLLLTKCENYTLIAYKTVNTLGLRSISRVIEIEARTSADITTLDYVFISGHKYMLEEGDVDEATGLTTFKALLI